MACRTTTTSSFRSPGSSWKLVAPVVSSSIGVRRETNLCDIRLLTLGKDDWRVNYHTLHLTCRAGLSRDGRIAGLRAQVVRT